MRWFLLPLLAGGWVAGLWAGLRLDLPPFSLALWALAFCALALFFSLRRAFFPLLLALTLVFSSLGALRAGWGAEGAPPPVSSLAPAEGITLRGWIDGDPEPRGTVHLFPVRVEVVVQEGEERPVRGRVRVLARPPAALVEERAPPFFRYGDALLLKGRLESPEGSGALPLLPFPQVTVLGEGRGVPGLGLLFQARHRLGEALARSLPEPVSALARSLLLGQRGDLPPEVREAFARSGTGHLLAISGLHVSVLLGTVLGVATALLGRRRWVLLLPLGAMWAYALLSGARPPVLRAGIMGSILLWGLWEGRRGSAFPALAVAGAVMAGVRPSLLMDLSFQMSFTAMAGLSLVAPPLEEAMGRWVRGRLGEGSPFLPPVRALLSTLAAGLGATAGVLPLLAVALGLLPLVGVPATLTLLPLLPLFLALGALTALGGLLFLPLGEALGWPAWGVGTVLLGLVRLWSLFPALEVSPPPLWAVWGYYGALGLLLGWRRARRLLGEAGTGLPLRWTAPPLALLSLLLWAGALSVPDGRLHIYFLNVGQGDATLLITPSGRQVLIDGGPDPRPLLRALGSHLPFWDRSLDLVVATHLHQDHIGGLPEVLRRYRVATVLEGPGEARTPEARAWRRALAREGARRVPARRGVKVRLGDGVMLQVLNPPEPPLQGTGADEDNNSVALRITYGGFSLLLPGEVHREAEEEMVRAGLPLRSLVLKVAHHGSRTSSTPLFLEAVSPVLAVISVGEGNPFGHPHGEVVERLRSLVGEGRLLLTSQVGEVHITTDGERLWVEAEHHPPPPHRNNFRKVYGEGVRAWRPPVSPGAPN